MRISRDQAFMECAFVWAKRSTCFRANVGAVLVFDNGIIGHGYNGPPSKHKHCQGNSCTLTENGGCARSVHAERNAINRGIERVPNLDLTLCTLYTTTLSCEDCADYIVDKKIERVVYSTDYRIKTGLETMREHGVTVHRLTPSGYLIDPFTNRIIEGH